MITPTSASAGSSDLTVHVNAQSLQSRLVIQTRVQKASEFSGIPADELMSFLNKIGIEDTPQGLQLLDSEIASAEVLEKEAEQLPTLPTLKRKAVVAILKGIDPFKKDPPERKIQLSNADSFAEIIKANRDIHNIKTRELLEMFDKERENEMALELDRRAKHQRFIVLKEGKHERGKEPIDIDTSIELLKRAIKGVVIPTMCPGPGNKIVNVYRITELNPEDRIIELCPICGEVVFRGYCSKCELNFAGIPDDERAYVALIAKSNKFDARSHSDRKAVYASASKGLEDLRETWPSISQQFDDLKLTNSLPRIRMMQDRPATQVADPFHQNGHRSF